MKQITKLSPHQNGKVIAVLMGLGSLVFTIPILVVTLVLPPQVDSQGHTVGPPPVLLVALFPVLYTISGYVMAAIGSKIYNFIVKYTVGIEFESGDFRTE